MNENIKKYKIETDWLGIKESDEELFNPMTFVFDTKNVDEIISRMVFIMSKPEYFYFTVKYILNVELLPFQVVMLQELWRHKRPMLIASRGASKSFTLAIYALLRCLLIPKRRVVVVGSAFRQSKVIFGYMEDIWNNAPVLRDLCKAKDGPYREVDMCIMKINDGFVKCLPLGSGDKIRGQRANDIIADEFASIPIEIFENVVQGFASVSSNVSDSVKLEARKKLGIKNKKDELFEKLHISNQVVYSGTAYYEFNHFAQ